jgi:hypothetical protein
LLFVEVFILIANLGQALDNGMSAGNLKSVHRVRQIAGAINFEIVTNGQQGSF